jgi:cobyrinic acid a,c-diamide synthase
VTTVRGVPRLVVSGLSGDSGKTLVSLALLLAVRDRGLPVCAFKKGPDYIDSAWLAWASGRPARNLDTFLMGADIARASFVRHALATGLNLIEGNRGLFDGVDAAGTHSTAVLARTLGAPILLVVDARKTTRTVAACILGCQMLGRDVRIAGVILNRVSGRRHEAVLRESVESLCDLPVLGVVPRAAGDVLLPGRHLGLVPPEEHTGVDELGSRVRELMEGGLAINHILAIARGASAIDPAATLPAERDRHGGPAQAGGAGLRIGYLRDSAFTFYYPENLEAIEAAGARLIAISALSDRELPADLDTLYIGGGFPETHGVALSKNRSFLESLRLRAEGGMPVYAECGGLMLLSRGVRWQGRAHQMAGVLPFDVEVCTEPQGHGYTLLDVDRPNPFFAPGLALRGHEFHYSRILPERELPETACAVRRGTGSYAGRDGVTVHNVWASYTHLHALGTPEWAEALLGAAGRHAEARRARCAPDGADP